MCLARNIFMPLFKNFAYLEQNFHAMKQLKTIKKHDTGGQYYREVDRIYKMNVL